MSILRRPASPISSRWAPAFVTGSLTAIFHTYKVQAISENSPHFASQQWPHRPRCIEGSVEHQTTPARFCATSIASSDATQQLSRAHHARRHVWQQEELRDGKDEQQWWKVWNKINFRTSASIHVSIEFIVHNFFYSPVLSQVLKSFFCFYWKHFSLV